MIPTGDSEAKARFRRLRLVPPGLLIAAACLEPYFFRLRSASLYSDDVDRIGQLQVTSLGGMLFCPFNEHVAPLLQGVSWLTWQLAGRQLARAPLAFTLAAVLPFVLTLGLLFRVIRRETGSATTALAVLAVFSLSWLPIETVYWYSASSFMWALLATLAAWNAAASGSTAGAVIASALAPAFCAIGLLAGPVAMLRGLADPVNRVGRGRRGSRAWVLLPIAGTAFYLAVCVLAFRYGSLLASSYERKANVTLGLLFAACAPAECLVPALVGLRTRPAAGLAVVLEIGATAAVVATIAYRSRRSESRPLVWGGMALIFAGYAMSFIPRVVESGRWVLETQRYHLFPMLGLGFLLAPGLKRVLGRFDASPERGLWAVAVLAVAMYGLHHGEMRNRARFFRFPDQKGTLAALDRLGEVCVRAHVTRAQALAALDPIGSVWTPVAPSVLTMLPPGAASADLPDALVKPTLLASLSPRDRRAVCGGMDATRYLTPWPEASGSISVGLPVRYFRVREGGAGRLFSEGWPSFIEFEMIGAESFEARALGLAALDPATDVEVWWKGDRGVWSETRSVRLRPGTRPRAGRAWLLPLACLPHWETADGHRIRLLFHTAGPVDVGAPRLVR